MNSTPALALAGALFAAVTLPAVSAEVAEDYPLTPDSRRQDGVPQGEVKKYTFENSKIFPGTWREYWVYVPRQYDASRPACVFISQDGIKYNAPIVFDNLIHQKQMPVTIGVFVMHGRVRAADPTNALDRFNRSYEYDGLGDAYARFLLEELLPDVERKTTEDGRGIRLSKDGNDRCIGGASSGAICAFTAAWERPDAFRRVYSSIGTFVGLRGGDVYPTLIRKTEPLPIRIYLQDGSNDLNIYGGDWWFANQMMERALAFSGYDAQHAWGTGGHDNKQADAVFPDAIRWLWRDYPKPIQANPNRGSRQPVVTEVLAEGEDWQLVSEGHRFTEGPAVNQRGELFFTDIPNNRIHKVSLEGKVSEFAADTGGANGLRFGPDGRLYACAGRRRQIVAYDESAKSSVIAEGLDSNDLAIDHRGNIFVTDPNHNQVWLLPKGQGGEKRVVDKGLSFPNGIALSPDQTLLYVADMRGQFVYSYQIQADGSLAHKQRYYHLHLADGSGQSNADGITVDAAGRLYVTTDLGLQFCDQAGRVNGIIRKPQRAWLSNVALAGPELDTLYVTCGDKVYKRKVKAKGVLAFNAPVRPRPPRL
jgi:gluconolactonase